MISAILPYFVELSELLRWQANHRDDFSAIFTEENNFCDFIFDSLEDVALPKRNINVSRAASSFLECCYHLEGRQKWDRHSCLFWMCVHFFLLQLNSVRTNEHIQSTLVISTSVISNNRLCRRGNVVLVLLQKSKIRLQNIVEKRRNCSWGAISPPFHNIFKIYF